MGSVSAWGVKKQFCILQLLLVSRKQMQNSEIFSKFVPDKVLYLQNEMKKVKILKQSIILPNGLRGGVYGVKELWRRG